MVFKTDSGCFVDGKTEKVFLKSLLVLHFRSKTLSCPTGFPTYYINWF